MIIRLLLFMPVFIFAQELLKIEKAITPIKVDGIMDDAEWGHLKSLEPIVGSPVFRMKATEKTEMYLSYDEQYLYVAARLFDKNAGNIKINTLKRDDWTNDESFGIILDTFDDNENAVGFVTTPAGIRIDFSVENDAVSNRGFPMNMTWNSFWDAASSLNDDGWITEMRIPFSSLKFVVKDGKVNMGMLLFRYIIKNNEAHNFPEVDPKYSWGFVKPSLAQTIEFEGIKNTNPVYITPYVLGGTFEEWEKENAGYTRKLDWTKEIGLDIKYNLSNNLTLDLTLNTDFAQVEADDERVNLSQFSLFFPEKRAFFQERSSLFNFSTGGPTKVFYSRKIGISDSGKVPILGGARLVGRINGWDLGFINMQTDKSKDLNSENFAVFRLRKSIINPYSYAGLIATSRLSKGSYNYVYGLDSDIRFGKSDYYLNFRWAQSFDNDSTYSGKNSFQENSRFQLSFQTRRNKGFAVNGFFIRSGEFYNPEMGFVTIENYYGFGGRLAYTRIFDDKNTALFNRQFSMFTFNAYDNQSNLVKQSTVNFNFEYNYKSTAALRFELKLKQERLDDELDLPDDVTIQEGFYKYHRFGVVYNSPFGNRVRYGGGLNGGTFFGGKLVQGNVNFAYGLSKYLELNSNFIYSTGSFDAGKFNTYILRLKTKSSINRNWSASSFIQFNSENKQLAVNLRLRYNPFEGTDFYVVYDELYNRNRSREIPTLPLRENRTVLIKFNYTLKI